MYIHRKIPPSLLLTISVLVALSFLSYITLVSTVVESTGNPDDLHYKDAIQRFPRDIAAPRANPSDWDTEDPEESTMFNEGEEDPSSIELTKKQKNRPKNGQKDEETLDIVALRLSLLKDALVKLEQMAQDVKLNDSEYDKLVQSTNTSHLCKYYNQEGKLKRYSLPKIWSDTGYYFEEDVTLVTQITFDKLGPLNELLTHWTGPVSCSLYLDKQEIKHLPGFLSKFTTILQRENLDLHLSYKSGHLYPINNLRNLALNNSYTNYALLMDVDFMPSHGLSEYLSELIPTIDGLKDQVLVLPCMEFTTYAGIPFPDTKEKLLELWDLQIVASSESLHYPPSHKPTNYTRWRTAVRPYMVDYMESYEPYIIGRRDLLPRYNEAFLNGFRDKIVHILHVHALGFKFTVIPNHYAVHIPHSRQPRPPFYECATQLYQDFVGFLTERGLIKKKDFLLKQTEGGTKPRKRVVRKIIRKIIRRRRPPPAKTK